MANQPGLPGSQFQGEDALVRRVQDLERMVQQLAAANPFTPMGMKPTQNGVEFAGNMKVLGTLDLPAGIIGNDALANPITTGSAGFTASNQAFNTASTNYGTQTIVVPAGFTKAIIMNGVSAGATNSTATGDYLYVAADIDGTKGGEIPVYANPSYYASASAFAIRTMTGLTAGTTIGVATRVRTNAGSWAATGANVVNINALALFYR